MASLGANAEALVARMECLLVAAQWDDMLELPTVILVLNNASRGNDIDLESD